MGGNANSNFIPVRVFFRRRVFVRIGVNNINVALDPGSTSHATVFRRFERFTSGDRILKSHPRSGRPSVLDDEDLRYELQLNSDVTKRELIEALNCSHHSVEYHMHEVGHHKVLARCVPLSIAFVVTLM